MTKNKNCLEWNKRGHNWLSLKGSYLFWRRYRVCIVCNRIERVKK